MTDTDRLNKIVKTLSRRFEHKQEQLNDIAHQIKSTKDMDLLEHLRSLQWDFITKARECSDCLEIVQQFAKEGT